MFILSCTFRAIYIRLVVSYRLPVHVLHGPEKLNNQPDMKQLARRANSVISITCAPDNK